MIPMSTKIAIALNGIDYFLFIAYGFLAKQIGENFFNSATSRGDLLFGLSVFLVGFISKPLGSIIFGRVGDTWGRRLSLQLTFITTLFAVAAIAVCPSYESVGVWATISVILGRFVHGMTHGAHNFGVIVYVTEQQDEGKKNLACGLLTGSSYAGILCASVAIAVVTLLGIEDGWRYVFGLGVIAGIPLVYCFKFLPETVEFVKQRNLPEQVKMPWYEYVQPFAKSFLLTAASLVPFYVISVYFIGNYYLEFYHFTHYQSELINSLFIFTLMLGVPVFGYYADKIDAVKLMTYSLLSLTVLSALSYINTFLGNSAVILTVNIVFVAIAYSAFIGSFIKFQAELFPVKHRFTLLALSGNIGSIIFGGAMPLIVERLVYLTKAPGVPFFVVGVCSLCGVLTLMWKPKYSAHVAA